MICVFLAKFTIFFHLPCILLILHVIEFTFYLHKLLIQFSAREVFLNCLRQNVCHIKPVVHMSCRVSQRYKLATPPTPSFL